MVRLGSIRNGFVCTRNILKNNCYISSKISQLSTRGFATMFTNKNPVPPDPVFSVTEAFKNDTSELKVNLGVGAYQDEQGKPWVLPVVRKADKMIAEDNGLNKEYLPIFGHQGFIDSCVELVYGKGNPILNESRISGVQTLSGAGACRVALEYLIKYQNVSTIYVSKPTWAIHHTLSAHSGFKDIREYRYYDNKDKKLDVEGMIEDFQNAPERSVILLHGAGHNPTGVDPTPEQWDRIAEIFKQKHIFPFFDCAYMGFCTGDVDKDAYAIRKFATLGFEMFVGVSFSKIMGLYNERVGCLSFLCNNEADAKLVKDQVKIIIRNSYSNPPAHGARLVHTILKNDSMKEEWFTQLNVMTDRIIDMRQQLYNRLTELKTPGSWKHIVDQKGLFSFTGLTPDQVEKMKDRHVYMTKNGRINICGLTPSNIDYVAKSIDEVVRMSHN